MKHCYEPSKHKTKPECDWKGNENTKGKWPLKRERPQDVGEKDNVAPYKKFSAIEKGDGPQPEEQ